MAHKAPPQAGVYRISSGSVFYIGATKDFENRRNHHRWLLSKGRHHSPKLQASYLASGVYKFERLRITAQIEDLPWLEQEILNLYAGNINLSNINSSATGPDAAMKKRNRERMADPIHSAATRERMAEAKRGARNIKSRAVELSAPSGEIRAFPCISAMAEHLGVSQQLADAWMAGRVAWPTAGGRTKPANRWLADYSAKYAETKGRSEP